MKATMTPGSSVGLVLMACESIQDKSARLDTMPQGLSQSYSILLYPTGSLDRQRPLGMPGLAGAIIPRLMDTGAPVPWSGS